MMGVVPVTLVQLLADAAPTAPSDVWDWITASTSITDLLSASGLVAFVALFTTNRILTIGQHRSRIADLEKFHAAQLAAKDDAYAALELAKDERYNEMRESRDVYKEAAAEERAAREKAESGVRELGVEFGQLTTHLLGSLDAAGEKP